MNQSTNAKQLIVATCGSEALRSWRGRSLWLAARAAIATVVVALLPTGSALRAEHVLPAIGGDQVTMMMGAPMKHLGIAFDGHDLHVHADDLVATPLLRKLTPPAEFDPIEKWAVLIDKPYNFQYGWVAETIWSPPPGAAVWVEMLSVAPGLETYEGGRFMSEATIRAMSFEPILGTAGSSPIWKWNGVMTHNAYAVANPLARSYEATYRVYLGDGVTGAELRGDDGQPRYGSDTVSIRLNATPVPEPGAAMLVGLGVAIGATRRRRRVLGGTRPARFRAGLRPTASIAILAVATNVPAAAVEIVIPRIGGGQVGMESAPMKHADISIEGSVVQVQVDESVEVPTLRPLDPGYAFDDQEPWNVLSGKAYNFQYGWNPGGFISVPAGSWIWVERLAASAGLESYQRPPATPAYEPIFGTEGSSLRWRWGGSMTHNVYAVAGPQQTSYKAVYRVYVGDDVSGEPTAGYAPAEVTFLFQAIVDPLGDFNDDANVDGTDLLTWQRDYGMVTIPGDGSDGTGDGLVDGADLALWEGTFPFQSAPSAGAMHGVPEPATSSLLAVGLLAVSWRRARG